MALVGRRAAGASVLEVDAHLCSIPADAILNISFGLNLGAANEEVVTVVGVGSLLLQSPLRFDHNTSEALVLLDPPAPPPYPPSPPPPTPPSPPSAPPTPPPSPPPPPPPSPTFPNVNFGRGGGPSAEGLGANAGDGWSMKHGTTQWLWLLLILAETVLLLITAFVDATDAHALSQPVAKEARLTMLEKEGPLPGWWRTRRVVAAALLPAELVHGEGGARGEGGGAAAVRARVAAAERRVPPDPRRPARNLGARLRLDDVPLGSGACRRGRASSSVRRR